MDSEHEIDLIRISFQKFLTELDFFDEAVIEATNDEAVGNYIAGGIKQLLDEIWLDLAENNDTNEFDVDNLIDMIDAYVVGFSGLDRADVCRWLISLKRELATYALENAKTGRCFEEPMVHQVKALNDCKIDPLANNNAKNSKSTKATPPPPPIDKSLQIVDPFIDQLVEIFPNISIETICQKYKNAEKNCEETIRLLLIEDEFRMFSKKEDEDPEVALELTDEERQILKEKTVKK